MKSIQNNKPTWPEASSASLQHCASRLQHEDLPNGLYSRERRFHDLCAEAHRLKDTISLAAVIGPTLKLERCGRIMVALCPFHTEMTPSFCVYSHHYHCYGCGTHGDAFDWLMKRCGITFRQAVELLGGRRPQPTKASVGTAVHKAHREGALTVRRVMRVWDQAMDATSTIVKSYLASRGGLLVPDGAPIRFHPRCQRGPIDLPGGPEHWPAMVALMTDALTGQPVGVHRTFLLPDGSGKAPTTARGKVKLRPKMVLGHWGVIRLTPDDQIGRGLAIAEGIENALTASQLIGWGPVWAAGCRGGIANFPVLTWLEFNNGIRGCE